MYPLSDKNNTNRCLNELRTKCNIIGFCFDQTLTPMLQLLEKKWLSVQLAIVIIRERDLSEITRLRRKPTQDHKFDDMYFFKVRCNYLCSVKGNMLITKNPNGTVKEQKSVQETKVDGCSRYDIMK